MTRIEAEAKRMGVLVDDLLTLARMDEERELLREDVDLSALARDAVEGARAAAPDREVTLTANGPVVVEGDAGRLRQVVDNLVRNAIAHTPAGTPVELRGGRDETHAQLERARPRPRAPTGGPERAVRALLARRGRARARAGRRRASDWRSSPASWRPTAAR